MKDQSDDPSHHERTLLPRSDKKRNSASFAVLLLQSYIASLNSSPRSVVVYPLLVRWVDGSIPHGGATGYVSFSQYSTTDITKAVVCAILSLGSFGAI